MLRGFLRGSGGSGGGGGMKRYDITASMTVPNVGYEILIVVTGAGGINLTLPAVTAARGFPVNVENKSAGTVTHVRAGADTIDGVGANFVLASGYSSRLISDRVSDWNVPDIERP
ncbi:MAG: hypothetical protein ABII82_05270 [Verrucomicrobiota bacterium]